MTKTKMTKKTVTAWIKYLQFLSVDMDAYECSVFESDGDVDQSVFNPLVDELAKLGIPMPSETPIPDSEGQFYYCDEDEDQAASVAPNLHALFRTFIENYSILYNWVCRNMDFTGSLGERMGENSCSWSDFICLVPAIALTHIDDTVMLEAGAEAAVLAKYKERVYHETVQTICNLCDSLQAHGLPITQNYFSFIQYHPGELDDERVYQCAGDPDHHIPWGERRILTETVNSQTLLLEINFKLDLMLTPAQREFVEKTLGPKSQDGLRHSKHLK